MHHFRLAKLTEGLAKIVADLDDSGKKRFVTEWNDKPAADVSATVDRIKVIIEKETAGAA